MERIDGKDYLMSLSYLFSYRYILCYMSIYGDWGLILEVGLFFMDFLKRL